MSMSGKGAGRSVGAAPSVKTAGNRPAGNDGGKTDTVTCPGNDIRLIHCGGKGVAGGLNKRSKMVVENICETKEGLCCFYHLAESVGGHLFCIVWQFCPCFICGLFNALHGDAGRTGLDALQSHKCRDG